MLEGERGEKGKRRLGAYLWNGHIGGGGRGIKTPDLSRGEGGRERNFKCCEGLGGRSDEIVCYVLVREGEKGKKKGLKNVAVRWLSSAGGEKKGEVERPNSRILEGRKKRGQPRTLNCRSFPGAKER